MNFIITSCFTKNTPYEEEVKIMVNSCKQYGMDVYLKSFPTQGNWEKNCWIKPVGILDALNQFPDKNILYLDTDAIVLGPLDYFNSLECDIACHNLEKNEKLTSTIFLKNTLNVRAFVAYWYTYIINCASFLGEQSSIDTALQTYGPTLNIKYFDLPPEYAKIFDRPSLKDVIPIIQQNQASRRFKRIINS